MALTPEQTKDAFLAKIPRMRRDFAQRYADFRAGRIFHDADYMRKYPREIFRLAEEELLARHRAAEEGVQRLLDSGWTAAADRDEVVVHVAELEDELETISPRPTKLKAALGAIVRIAGPAALETVKAAVEGAVAGLVKGSGII